MVSYPQDLRLLLRDEHDDTPFNEGIRKLIKASLLCGAFSAAYTLPRLSWESQLPTLSTEATLALVAGVAIPVGGLVKASSLTRKWRADKVQMERKAMLQSEKLRVPALEIARLGGWMPQPGSLSGGHATGMFDLLRFIEKRCRRRAVRGMLKARKQMLRIDENKAIADAMNEAAKAETNIAKVERLFHREKDEVESHVAKEEKLRLLAEHRATKAQADEMECLGCLLLMEEEVGGDSLVSPQEEEVLAQGHTQATEELTRATRALRKVKGDADAAEGRAARRVPEVQSARKQLMATYRTLSEELQDLPETKYGTDAGGAGMRLRLSAAAEVCVSRLEAEGSSAVRHLLDQRFQARDMAETAGAALIKVQSICTERLQVAETLRQRAEHMRLLQNTVLDASGEIQRAESAGVEDSRAEVTALLVEGESKIGAEENVAARLEQELNEFRAGVETRRAKANADLDAAAYRAEEIRTQAGADFSINLDVTEGRCIALEHDRHTAEKRACAAESEYEKALLTLQESVEEFKNDIAALERRREEAETRLAELRATRERRARAEREASVQEQAQRRSDETRNREETRKRAEEAAIQHLEAATLRAEEAQRKTDGNSQRQNEKSTQIQRENEEAGVRFETHAQSESVGDGAKAEDAKRKENASNFRFNEGAKNDTQNAGRSEANLNRTAGDEAESTVHAEADILLRNQETASPLSRHEAKRWRIVGEAKREAAEVAPKYEKVKTKFVARLQLEEERENLNMVQSARQPRLQHETRRMSSEESMSKSENPGHEAEPATLREDEGISMPKTEEDSHVQKRATQLVETLEETSHRHEECASETVMDMAGSEPNDRRLREERPTTNVCSEADVLHHGVLAQAVHTLQPPPGLSPRSATSPVHAPDISMSSLPAIEGRCSGGGYRFDPEPPNLAPTAIAAARGSLPTPRLPPGLGKEVGVIDCTKGTGQESVGLFLDGDGGGNGGRVGGGRVGGGSASTKVPSRGQTKAIQDFEGRENVTIGRGLGLGACGGEDLTAEDGAKKKGKGEDGALKDLLKRAGCVRHLPRFKQEQIDFEAAGYMSEELLVKFDLTEVYILCECVPAKVCISVFYSMFDDSVLNSRFCAYW